MMRKVVRPFDISQIEIAVLTATIASLFSITQSRSIAPASSKGVERHWSSQSYNYRHRLRVNSCQIFLKSETRKSINVNSSKNWFFF